jgi:hypothetical protein
MEKLNHIQYILKSADRKVEKTRKNKKKSKIIQTNI